MEKLEVKYLKLEDCNFWGDNFKKHDSEKLIESIEKHGFKDPPKFEPSLNSGQGGIIEGNGRIESLKLMKARGMKRPRGIEHEGEAWLVPVLFGVDSETEAGAEAYGIDHNALVLPPEAGPEDYLALWEEGFEIKVHELEDQGEVLADFGLEKEEVEIPVYHEEELEEKYEKLEPYEYFRVLISVDVSMAERVREKLKELTDIDGINILYGAN